MADPEVTSNMKGSEGAADGEETGKKEPTFEEIQRAQYLDPEGGYSNPSAGLEAEKKAMMSQPEVHKNALPTKMYLEATVTPTVMKALQEVCEARPENPLEFVAYYLLKHNPDKQELNNEGAPIGHFHPQDPAATKKE